TAHFARRLRDRPAHLPADLFGDLHLVGDEGVDGAGEELLPFAAAQAPTLAGSLARALERCLDLRVIGERTFDIDSAVNRRDAFQPVRHVSISGSSDDLEIALQLPIGDVLALLALLPFTAGGVVLDESIAEK